MRYVIEHLLVFVVFIKVPRVHLLPLLVGQHFRLKIKLLKQKNSLGLLPKLFYPVLFLQRVHVTPGDIHLVFYLAATSAHSLWHPLFKLVIASWLTLPSFIIIFLDEVKLLLGHYNLFGHWRSNRIIVLLLGNVNRSWRRKFHSIFESNL